MKEFTTREVAQRTKLTYSQIYGRMKARNVTGRTANDMLLINEFELEIISRQRNMTVDFNTEFAIIQRFKAVRENQISRICDYFQVSEITVSRIINEHLKGYEIFESKLNNPDFECD